jgi:ketosteroid isomerase-like protein
MSALVERATALLHAFGQSDTTAIDRLCTDDVLLWGTDDGEAWEGKSEIVDAFAGVFDLGVRWLGDPVTRDEWVAGSVEFDSGAGGVESARVTMIFRDGLLAHAHYSVAIAA